MRIFSLLLIILMMIGCGERVVYSGRASSDELEPGCVEGVELGEQVEVGRGEGGLQFQSPVVLGSDGVYGARVPAGEQDLEVFRVGVDGVEARLTDNDLDDRLLDANDGAWLLTRAVDGDRTSVLVIHGDDEGESLVQSGLSGVAFERLQLGDVRRTGRLVEGGFAAWPMPGSGEVVFWDGALRAFAQEGVPGARMLDFRLGGGQVVWVELDGEDQEVMWWDGERVSRVTDNAIHDQRPVFSEGVIYWLTPEAVMAFDTATRRREVIHEGACIALDTQGGAAAFVCREEVIGEGGFDIFGDALFHWAGGRERRVETRGGQIFDARVRGDVVAWVEYADPSAWCSPGEAGVLLMEGAGGGVVEVAPILSGCLCCAMSPEPMQLRLEEGAVMWSHAAAGRQGGFGGAGDVGIRAWSRVCR